MSLKRVISLWSTAILLILYLLATYILCLRWFPVYAQEKSPEMSGSKRKSSEGVIFKAPDGYMPLDFEKFKGVLMIDPKNPKGMFVAYPDAGQSTDDQSKQIHSSIGRMFFHDSTPELKWNTSVLPGHEGNIDESGTLSIASNEKQEIQVAAYTRTIGGSKIMYGYFAMRNKPSKEKGKESKGFFVDESGKGVKEFDKFWRSIKKE